MNDKLERNAAYGKNDGALIPRITVRDHDDLHMLIALMGDAVDNLRRMDEADRLPGREGAMDPLVQARTMLANLRERHADLVNRERQQADDAINSIASEFVRGLEAIGVTVHVVDLENL